MTTPFEAQGPDPLQPLTVGDTGELAPVIPLFPIFPASETTDLDSGILDADTDYLHNEIDSDRPSSADESYEPAHDTSEEAVRGRFKRLWHGVGRAWLNTNIRASLVLDNGAAEYAERTAAATKGQKFALQANIGGAVGGQVYERFRGPEVVGVAITTNAYKEALERGMNTGIATAIAAAALGIAVFFQQKAIGRNMVRMTERFPETFETVNQMWPKGAKFAEDAALNPKNPVAEGSLMFGLGTTPFIIAARAANPEISTQELQEIESRVTRRGSVFAAGVATTVFGAKSLAPHLPEHVKSFALREDAVNWSTNLLDFVSNPFYLSGSFIAWAGLKAVGRSIRDRREQQPALATE